MSPTEIRGTLIMLFGDGWRQKAEKKLSVHQSTLSRWSSGESPINPHAEAHIRTLVQMHKRQERLRAAWRKAKQKEKSRG